MSYGHGLTLKTIGVVAATGRLMVQQPALSTSAGCITDMFGKKMPSCFHLTLMPSIAGWYSSRCTFTVAVPYLNVGEGRGETVSAASLPTPWGRASGGSEPSSLIPAMVLPRLRGLAVSQSVTSRVPSATGANTRLTLIWPDSGSRTFLPGSMP